MSTSTSCSRRAPRRRRGAAHRGGARSGAIWCDLQTRALATGAGRAGRGARRRGAGAGRRQRCARDRRQQPQPADAAGGRRRRRIGWRRRCRRDVIGVSESGLQTRADLERLAAAGYDAFLIGERFMTDPDPGARATSGMLDRRRSASALTLAMVREGLRHHAGEDAEHAVAQGATALGFVFWPASPRYIAPERRGRDRRARCPRPSRPSACSSTSRWQAFAGRWRETRRHDRAAARRRAASVRGRAGAAGAARDRRWTPPTTTRTWPPGDDDPARRRRPGSARRHRHDGGLDEGRRRWRARGRVVLAGGLTPENVAGGDRAGASRRAWTCRRASSRRRA